MKKSLLAVAVVAALPAVAFAQSTVSIDGQFDAGYQSLNYKGARVGAVGGNGSTTSQINFRANQDLGGGLKADFRVETDWNTVSNNGNVGAGKADGTFASGSSFGNGEIRGGLIGPFGRVDFGAINNAQLDAFLTGQPYGTAIGSAFRGVFSTEAAGPMGSSPVRFDNSLRYITPAVGGFSASVLAVQKNNKANTSNFNGTIGNYDYAGVEEFSLRYNEGPINAIYATTKQKLSGLDLAKAGVRPADPYAIVDADGNVSPGPNPLLASTVGAQTYSSATNNTLGANYTFGDYKVFLLNQTAKRSLVAGGNDVDRQATSVSATYTMGNNVFSTQIGKAKNKIAGTSNTGNTSIFSLGYDYNLSKMTSIYVRYEKLGDKGGLVVLPSQIAAADMKGTDRTRTALGLRIGF